MLVVKCGAVCGRFPKVRLRWWWQGGEGVVWWWCRTCGTEGAMCCADMGDLFLRVVRVAASFSFTINPSSTNFWIVCCRNDRDGGGGFALVAVVLQILLVLVADPPRSLYVCLFYRGCFGLGFGVGTVYRREVYKG